MMSFYESCVPVSKAQAYICPALNNSITLKGSVKRPSLLLNYLLSMKKVGQIWLITEASSPTAISESLYPTYTSFQVGKWLVLTTENECLYLTCTKYNSHHLIFQKASLLIVFQSGQKRPLPTNLSG